MIRIFIAAILFFLLKATITYAQLAIPKDVNALYKQLAKSSADTSRVKILVNISRYYSAVPITQTGAPDSAFVAANQANHLAVKLAYFKGIGLSYQMMAWAWCSKKDFKKSDEFLKKAISVFLDHNLFENAAEAYLNMQEFYAAMGGNDYKIMIADYQLAAPLFLKGGAKLRAGETYNILGDYYLQIDKQDDAIAALKTALSLYQSVGYKKLQSVYDLLGNNYLQISNYKEALKYALLAVKTAEAQRDTSMLLCTIYNRTGMVYLETGQYEQANNYFKKSIAVAQKYQDKSAIYLSANLAANLIRQRKPAEAIAVLEESERHFPEIEEQYRIYYNAFYLQAYIALKRNTEAGKYSNKLLKIYSEREHSLRLELTMLGPVIQYFNTTGQYKQAAKYLPQYQSGSNKISGAPKFKLHAYLFSYQIDSAGHNYISAIRSYKKYTVLNDSISDATKNKQIRELQVQYETEKKEKENVFLRKEGILQMTKVRQADHIRNLTLAGSVILLIFIILLYYSYSVNQKNSKAISEKNDSLKQLVTEKEWLLKEIHHRVKNNLQIVMGLLQRQSAYIDNDDALAVIQNSENRMHSIALIHQKLYQSENLDLIFMPEYVNEMINYLRDSSGVDNRIFFEKQVDDIYLDVTQAVPLALILNEAITNAIKYAYQVNVSGVIYISLIKGGEQLVQLTIADDGPGLPKGFDIDQVDSMGINLMKGLAKQLGGNFDIGNEDGCTINISFKTEIFNRGIAEAELNLNDHYE